MNIGDILTIYEYNYWATQQILGASAQVSLEQFTVPTGRSFGSLRGTLVHILDSECAWRMLLHVVNHGTQHRSEAAAILTGYGHSPGGLDFTAFLNEKQ